MTTEVNRLECLRLAQERGRLGDKAVGAETHELATAILTTASRYYEFTINRALDPAVVLGALSREVGPDSTATGH